METTPWKIENRTESLTPVYSASGELIDEQMRIVGSAGTIAYISVRGLKIIQKQNVSNARLIACAPELLSALIDSHSEYSESYCDICSLIARAEGRA